MTSLTASMIAAIAEDWTYTPDGGSPVVIKADFTDEAKNIDLAMGSIGSTDPRILVAEADVPGLTKAALFTRNKTGRQYRMTSPDPDGTGGIIITLTKA